MSVEHWVKVLRTWEGNTTNTLTVEVPKDVAGSLTYGDAVVLVVPEGEQLTRGTA